MLAGGRYSKSSGAAHRLDRLQPVRLSPERIEALKPLLKKYCGRELDDAQAQQAGIAVIRFVLAKQRRQAELEDDVSRKPTES